MPPPLNRQSSPESIPTGYGKTMRKSPKPLPATRKPHSYVCAFSYSTDIDSQMSGVISARGPLNTSQRPLPLGLSSPHSTQSGGFKGLRWGAGGILKRPILAVSSILGLMLKTVGRLAFALSTLALCEVLDLCWGVASFACASCQRNGDFAFAIFVISLSSLVGFWFWRTVGFIVVTGS